MVRRYVGRSKVAEVRGEKFKDEAVYGVGDRDWAEVRGVEITRLLWDEIEVGASKVMGDRRVVRYEVIGKGKVEVG